MSKDTAFRWFPMPLHSLLMLVIWLMLNGSLSLGHVLLGSLLAMVIPWLCAPLQMPQPRLFKPFRAMRYILIVLVDVVIANVQVAILVLGPEKRLKPAFVAVPLDISGALPITVLASTVTMTPGTVSADVSEDRKWLYVHVLNLEGTEEELVEQIKSRYEQGVREIFAC